MRPKSSNRRRKQVVIGAADLEPGQRRIVEIDGKSIGLFNVKGEYYALHNRCPHMGGKLCEGPITGTALPTDKTEYIYGYDQELIRCGWHGWEFEIKIGRCLADERLRARTYPVTIQDDQIVINI